MENLDVLRFSQSDSFDDSPTDNVMKEAVDDVKERMASVADSENGPAFTLDLAGAQRLIIRNFPGGFSEVFSATQPSGLKTR